MSFANSNVFALLDESEDVQQMAAKAKAAEKKAAVPAAEGES
jgi:hypothetical protein